MEQENKSTILVVDDDPDILKFVSEFLAADYNVLAASSGEEGLQKAKNCKSDIPVLLSDFQMAEMTGVELATAIAAERPNIKVLLMSGFDAGMLVLNGGWHFLPKPFIPSQLRSLVIDMCSLDKASRFSGI